MLNNVMRLATMCTPNSGSYSIMADTYISAAHKVILLNFNMKCTILEV